MERIRQGDSKWFKNASQILYISKTILLLSPESTNIITRFWSSTKQSHQEESAPSHLHFLSSSQGAALIFGRIMQWLWLPERIDPRIITILKIKKWFRSVLHKLGVRHIPPAIGSHKWWINRADEGHSGDFNAGDKPRKQFRGCCGDKDIENIIRAGDNRWWGFVENKWRLSRVGSFSWINHLWFYMILFLYSLISIIMAD